MRLMYERVAVWVRGGVDVWVHAYNECTHARTGAGVRVFGIRVCVILMGEPRAALGLRTRSAMQSFAARAVLDMAAQCPEIRRGVTERT
jgi:hypothetical protein